MWRAWFGDEPWLAAGVLALGAVVAAMVAHWIVGGIVRRVTRSHAVLHSMVVSAETPAGIAWPLLALQLVWTALAGQLRYVDTVQHLNALALIGVITWLAMAVVSGLASGVIASFPTEVEDNLRARRVATQARVLSRTAMTLILIAGASMALMTFPGARQVGASLLASAGVLGIIGGLAARPVFSNLIAGLQIALAQPIRIDDVLIVNNEWGRVEEITGTYVVMRIWDDRRLIVPLNWFIENPFQNWTRTTAHLTGEVLLQLDFLTPLAIVREQAKKVVEAAPEWDQRVFVVQVVDATSQAMHVRILVSAAHAGKLFDLRCRVREEMITFLAREYPASLPRVRQINEAPPAAG